MYELDWLLMTEINIREQAKAMYPYNWVLRFNHGDICQSKRYLRFYRKNFWKWYL